MADIEKRQLEMETLIARDSDGIEMGVLADGTSYLTGRGLAAVCGVVPSVINQWANEYEPDSKKPRDIAIARLIAAQGYQGNEYFLRTTIGAQRVNAYPEKVCMGVLEYYGFEAERKNAHALGNFRVLARAGLRAFVYSQLGFDPSRQLPDPFRSYHERLMLNKVPHGMYSCFSETSHIVLESIRAGLIVDTHTVPDISVGSIWSKHWTAREMAAVYGRRSKFPHVYPADYPQSAVVPDAYIYPLASLGEFRLWLDVEYLPNKYPDYLKRKVKLGALPASRAELLLESLVPKALPEDVE
jgi:hypothetical protein